MLSRRHLRSKCLQILYAYFRVDGNNLASGEKELLHSINKVYDLYIYRLSLIVEISEFAQRRMEEGKNKVLPKPEDLNPNIKFVENRLVKKLRENTALKSELNARKINWGQEHELVKKLFLEIRDTAEYSEYMNSGNSSFAEDKEFIVKIYKKYLAESESLEYFFEEKSIYWMDDPELINSMVVKTFKNFAEDSEQSLPLMNLYNDEKDDREFVVELFRKTIVNSQEYEQIISDKTKNWEVDRIALMDILIMKMAMCEILNFPSIPVKVTLNEYIDISKRFSTPKSKVFVNGILDKIIADLKTADKIKKTGRGLIE
jgi:transcription antitermination protein NusB